MLGRPSSPSAAISKLSEFAKYSTIWNMISLWRDATYLMTCTEWLPGVRLRHSVPPVQYIERIVSAGEHW